MKYGGGTKHDRIDALLENTLGLHNGSRFQSPEAALIETESVRERAFGSQLKLTPMSDLDLMIRNGYADVSQDSLPVDWRTRRNGNR